MKQINKRRNLLLILGITIPLLFYQCQPEEQFIEETTEGLVSSLNSGITIRTNGTQEIQSNTLVMSQIDGLQSKKEDLKDGSTKDVYSEDYGLTVHTDFASYATYGDGLYHSYTFPISRATDTGLLENLVLSSLEGMVLTVL